MNRAVWDKKKNPLSPVHIVLFNFFRVYQKTFKHTLITVHYNVWQLDLFIPYPPCLTWFSNYMSGWEGGIDDRRTRDMTITIFMEGHHEGEVLRWCSRAAIVYCGSIKLYSQWKKPTYNTFPLNTHHQDDEWYSPKLATSTVKFQCFS